MPARKAHGRGGLGCLWQAVGLLAIAALGFAFAFLLTGDRGVVPIAREYAPPGGPPSQAHPPAAPPPPTSVPSPPDSTDDAVRPETPSAGLPAVSPPPSTPRPPAPPPAPDQWNEVSHGSRSSPRIALTFDAGADNSPTPDILAVLAKHNVRCTFFLTGKWIEKNPGLVRRIAAEGHELGNHTYSHRRLPPLSDGDIAGELNRVEKQVAELTGRSTKPLARVPYGSRNKRVLQIMAAEGYRTIYWDVDSWDSVKVGITSDQIKQRALERVQNGSIVLMHCGSRATANALDSLLEKLEASGYQPVTVGELIAL